MQVKTLPIIRQSFIDKLGKTAIETSSGTVWSNGDTSGNNARLVTIVINEIGDTFVAQKDSKQGYFKAGDTVTRRTQSLDFKSFDGAGQATEFAKAAQAFGLQIIYQMG
jgi:hypothetical protein